MTDENLELSVTHLIDAPVAIVWKIVNERLAEWWCPKPWTVEIIERYFELDRSEIHRYGTFLDQDRRFLVGTRREGAIRTDHAG